MVDKDYFNNKLIYKVEVKKSTPKMIIKYKIKDSLWEEENPSMVIMEDDVEPISVYECLTPSDRVWFQGDEDKKLRILVASNSRKTPDEGHRSTRFTVLDGDFNEIINFEVEHDRGGYFRGGYDGAYVRWMANERLFVSDFLVPTNERALGRHRSLVLDGKAKKIYRICSKEGEEELKDLYSKSIWNHGNNLLLSSGMDFGGVNCNQISKLRL